MSRVLMLAAAADRDDPLVANAVAGAADGFADAQIDLVLLSDAAGQSTARGPVGYWPVKVRLLAIPEAKGALQTLGHVVAINLNSRRRAAAASRSRMVRKLARQADVIISLSTPTDRAALRLGARLPIPLVAGLNAAIAARRRGEW